MEENTVGLVIGMTPKDLEPDYDGAVREGLSEAAISKRNKVVVDNKKKNRTKCFSSLRNAGTI